MMREYVKVANRGKNTTIHAIENADKNPKEIVGWINDVAEIHKKKQPPSVTYSKIMPDIENLMQVVKMNNRRYGQLKWKMYLMKYNCQERILIYHFLIIANLRVTCLISLSTKYKTIKILLNPYMSFSLYFQNLRLINILHNKTKMNSNMHDLY